MQAHPTFFAQLRTLLSRNELRPVLEQLRALLDKSPKLDEVLAQSGRFHALRAHIRLGVLSHAEASLAQNDIRAGLLDLLRDLEETLGETEGVCLERAPLREELAQAISVVHSKNVVVGSTISAGGNVVIGDQQTTVQNEGATIKNQFNGGTFHNPTFE